MGRKNLAIGFCTAILVLISANINAQKIRFGVHATPLFNYIDTDDDRAVTNSMVNLGFGLISEYALTSNYSLATGVDILARGGDLTFNDTTGTYKANFINIPLVLKMKSREFGFFTYFAKFGGGLSFKTGEEVSFEPGERQDLDDYIRPFNVTFAIGGGAEYSFGGSTAILAEITYNRSLFDNLSSDNTLLNDSQYRFDYIALTLGIIF